MISIYEPLITLVITLVALGWVMWRLWRARPKNAVRLAVVLFAMLLIEFSVNLFLSSNPTNLRVRFWFGAITSVLMALATYAETEPRPPS